VIPGLQAQGLHAGDQQLTSSRTANYHLPYSSISSSFFSSSSSSTASSAPITGSPA
jgi:hypothetical protein